MLALDRPAARATLVRRAETLRGRLRTLAPLLSRGLVAARLHGDPLTDDRAPVEWLTDGMLLTQIARGQGLDERSLPTAP